MALGSELHSMDCPSDRPTHTVTNKQCKTHKTSHDHPTAFEFLTHSTFEPTRCSLWNNLVEDHGTNANLTLLTLLSHSVNPGSLTCLPQIWSVAPGLSPAFSRDPFYDIGS